MYNEIPIAIDLTYVDNSALTKEIYVGGVGGPKYEEYFPNHKGVASSCSIAPNGFSG
jgi:hypothetical protein